MEVLTAKKNLVPIITVIDQDRYLEHAVIDQYMKMEHWQHIFARQVIGFTSEHRKATFEKLSTAVKRAVAKTHQTSLQLNILSTTIIESANVLRGLAIKKYGTAKVAVKAVNDGGSIISRKDFKRLVAKVGMDISDGQRKQLRKHIADSSGREITLQQFKIFLDEVPKSQSTVNPHLVAELPSEVYYHAE